MTALDGCCGSSGGRLPAGGIYPPPTAGAALGGCWCVRWHHKHTLPHFTTDAVFQCCENHIGVMLLKTAMVEVVGVL